MDVFASIMKLAIPFFVLVVSVLSAYPKNCDEGESSYGRFAAFVREELEHHGDILKSETAPCLMEDVILDAIEMLKEKLREGIPCLDIPPLDPLEIEHRQFLIDIKDILLLNGSVSDVFGLNILSFNASKLSISLMPMSFEIRLDWDSIDIRGKYDIDGTFLSIIPIYGNGSFEGDYSGIYFYFRMEIGTKAAQMVVKNLDLDFGIKTVNLKIENFLGGALGDALCEMISEIFPQVIRQLKVAYLADVKDGIKRILDGFFEGKTMQDLIDFLLGLFVPLSGYCPKGVDGV